MRIQHNIAALNSHRQLTNNNSSVSKNLEKLSSGYRINRAGDDAAGLAISEKMRAQITGLDTAQKNAQDGISLVQTAEGALTEVHSMLNRMTELAGQSANGTYQDAVDRENIQKELDSLRSEIDRISEGTNFNGIKLLDGSMGSGTTGVSASVAADAGNSKVNAFNFDVSGVEKDIKVEFKAVASADAGDDITAAWNGTTLTFTMKSNDTAFGNTKITQEDIDKAIKNASGAPAAGAGIQVKIDKDITFSAKSAAGTVASVTTQEAQVASTKSTDNKFSVTSTKAGNDVRKLIMAQGSVGATINALTGDVTLNLESTKSYTASEVNSILSKAGANMTVKFDGSLTGADIFGKTGSALSEFTLAGGQGLAGGGGLELQIGESAESFNQLTVAVASMSSSSLGLSGVDVGTQAGAKAAIDIIKGAIDTVSSTRGDLGAIQNRLEHTISNLGVTSENMSAAESRIRDVDMAQEMMSFTKNNILTQASQAMLAQANQLPQGVLQLLQ